MSAATIHARGLVPARAKANPPQDPPPPPPPSVIAQPVMDEPTLKSIEVQIQERGLVALAPTPKPPPTEPEEESAEGRSLVTLARMRRTLAQSVEDFKADVAAQRVAVRTAAQQFGNPQFDGSDAPARAVEIETAKLSALLASQHESEQALEVHVRAHPTEAEMQDRIATLRYEEAAKAKSATRSSYTQHMLRAAEILEELESELNAAYQVIKAAKPGHFRRPDNCAYFAQFFSTAVHPGNGDDARRWRQKLDKFLTDEYDPNGL
jgi:hypothetical protein